MSKRNMLIRVAEVSYNDRIDEYEVASTDNVQARDLMAKYLGDAHQRNGIRIRETPIEASGEARVIRKIEGEK